MGRKEKETFISQLTDTLKTNNNFILADYRGLNAEEITDLRNKMHRIGCELKVVKNTLTRLAMRNLKLENLVEYLRGPTAIAFEKTDVILATKALVDFSRQHQNLKIKAGFLEGRLIRAQDVESLARLPAREILIAQICRALQAPIVGFCRALQGVVRNLVVILVEIRRKKSAGQKEE